jgi:hypothetical protein
MKNEVESDMQVLAEAQRIIADKGRSDKPDGNDVKLLAEARRIQEDEDRSDAVRKHMREKKKEGRKADVFAGEGSFAGKLKARREAMEDGDPEGAGQVFIK